MSSSGPRAADDINLDEFERRLRAAGAQQARAEDPLAELTRLVEFAHLGIANDEAPAGRRAEPAAAPAPSATPIEKDALRPAVEEEVEDLAPGASEEREARPDYAFDAHAFGGAGEPEPPRRSMRWKIAVSALALAGLAMIGAVVVLKNGAPGFKKNPPFIAAAQGPTKVAPPSEQTVAASSDGGASLRNDTVKPGAVKLVNSEEQPVDLSAQASLANPPPANPPPAAPNPPAAADQATPAPGTASDATSLAAPVATQLVPPPAPQPPAMTSEFPTPKPVRTVSLRPDGTPIGNPPDQPASAAEPASAPAEAPVPAPKASEAAGAPQPSTPRLDLPATPSAKSSARVVVGKTDTTAPEPNAETPREPSAKPARAAKRPKGGEVADAGETTGAIAEPVDATAATASGGWAVQLAAPRSEAEASREIARLTAKYGAELNGSPIGVHKATVKGETIYRLRVVGLTKADAAKLCARLKGEGAQCFIAR